MTLWKKIPRTATWPSEKKKEKKKKTISIMKWIS